MALIGLKQLDPILTGSLQVSGSAGVTGSLSLIGSTNTPNAKILINSSNNKMNIGDTIVVSDGNNRVGMGDSAPSAPDTELHIKSDTPVITLQRTANADRSAIEFQGHGGSVGSHIEFVSDVNDLSFGTFDGSKVVERLRLEDGAGANIKVSGSTQITGSLNVSSSMLANDSEITDTLTVGGHLYISDSIVHSADTNTKIRFPEADTISFHTSGDERMRISTGGHITASGDVSSSATSTGSFGRVEAGKVGASDGFYHSLDADEETYIKFPTGDKIDIVAGGVNFIYAWQKDADVNKLIFNEDNTDTDIVFRSANGSNNKLLYLDASADKVGIRGNGLPPEALTVEGNISASGALMGVTHVTASGNISGSTTSTGSFGSLEIDGDIKGASLFITSSGESVVQVGNGGTTLSKWEWHRDGERKWVIYNDGRANPFSEQDSLIFKHGVSSDGNDHINFYMNPDDQNVYFEGNVTASGALISETHVTASGNISSSLSSTGSFGVINVGGGHFTSASLAAGGAGGGGIFEDVGTSKTTTNNLQISGSLIVSGSTLTVRTGTDSGPPTASTAIYTNNITNGYPTSNRWQESLDGSYFNNFDHTTHVSEILRFMAGIISHSIDTASPTPNTKTFASVDTNNNNLGSTANQIDGRLPQNYSSIGNATLNYLVLKGWTGIGAKIFDGISIYNDDSYFIDFDSNSGGSTSIQSSADSELFGLGGLTSGGATQFDVRVIATQSFSDTPGLTTPTAVTNSFTTQSFKDYTMTDFGTTSGVTLAKIESANPAVIPAAYQDGKFENIGGTDMSGSLTRRYSGSNPSLFNDFTSVSASGYYNMHDLKVGISTGSGAFTFVNGTDRKYFSAPRAAINTAIGSNSLADVGTTTRYLTAVSRSLSGVPYVTGSTYEISTKITGLFNPLYAGTTTLTDMNPGSVGVGSTSITNDNISTSGGTIQTSNAIYDSTGASARSTSTVPYYNDIAIVSASVDWDAGNDENINQTGVGDTTFTVTVRARDRDSDYSSLDTQTIFYHSASMFGTHHTSGSMAVYGRAQGYDGGSLTGTTETFTGESYRIQLTDEVLGWSGSAFSTSFNISQVPGTRLIGEQDLQVKPGYLVNPGGTYGYWYPNNYGSGSYKYYIRRFQTSGTKTSMTINLNNTALVNWKATTNNSVACGLLFKSSASGSGATSKLSRARIYDPTETTSNLISSSVAHQTDFHLNPFSSTFDLYGNTGGSVSSNTYTVPMRNSDGMYLDNNDNELYVIVRYSGDPTPLDDITLTFS